MWGGLTAPALFAAMTLGGAGHAQPVTLVEDLPDGVDVAVVDIRPEADCLKASLPDARCLPADWLVRVDESGVIGFHALRWLLGTIGLDGRETLAVYPGPDGPTQDAWAVGALTYLAGQADVVVLAGGTTGRNGWPRNENREAVYTAPMRVAAMTVDASGAPLRDQLADFAQGRRETVAFAPDT